MEQLKDSDIRGAAVIEAVGEVKGGVDGDQARRSSRPILTLPAPTAAEQRADEHYGQQANRPYR